MYKIIMSMIIMMLISMFLMVMCSIISKHNINDREKSSPFECGFDPQSSSRMPFSIQFFMVAVLFLIFDIEIVIILPIVTTMFTSNTTTWMLTVMMFTMILIIGLLHEWNNGVLDWAN